MTRDKFDEIFRDQRDFMELLQRERNFPEFPVDITSKEGQKLLKTISYELTDELHEARQHLKNKSHRATLINEVDREAYVEELADSLHYFVELLIASGITPDEIFDSYMRKGEVNRKRIVGGY